MIFTFLHRLHRVLSTWKRTLNKDAHFTFSLICLNRKRHSKSKWLVKMDISRLVIWLPKLEIIWKICTLNRSKRPSIGTCHFATQSDQPPDPPSRLHLSPLHQDFDCHHWAAKRLTPFPPLYVLRCSPRRRSRRAIWLMDTLPIFQITSQARGQDTSTREMWTPPPPHDTQGARSAERSARC